MWAGGGEGRSRLLCFINFFIIDKCLNRPEIIDNDLGAHSQKLTWLTSPIFTFYQPSLFCSQPAWLWHHFLSPFWHHQSTLRFAGRSWGLRGKNIFLKEFQNDSFEPCKHFSMSHNTNTSTKIPYSQAEWQHSQKPMMDHASLKLL